MITVATVGDALTDTFSANMEQCNQYKQSRCLQYKIEMLLGLLQTIDRN